MTFALGIIIVLALVPLASTWTLLPFPTGKRLAVRPSTHYNLPWSSKPISLVPAQPRARILYQAKKKDIEEEEEEEVFVEGEWEYEVEEVEVEEEEEEEVELDEEEYDEYDLEDDDEEEVVVDDVDDVEVVESTGKSEEEVWVEEEVVVEPAAKEVVATVEWEEEEEEEEFPLQDDPSNPNYMKQRELIEQDVAASEQRQRDRDFDPYDFMQNQMTPEMMQEMDQLPFIQEAVARAKEMTLTEMDLDGMDIAKELQNVPDLMDDDPYPRHEPDEINHLERNVGLTDDDMEQVDNSWKMLKAKINEPPFDLVAVRANQGIDGLDNETVAEIENVLEEMGGAPYNVTKMLLYDLEFNVTNLMLAAVKHNREAPLFLAHWYPQLITYERYAQDRETNFDYSWDDVEAADLDELKRYYKGMGHDEIPSKAPGETGIIEFDYLDEEEMKMAAFESWMTEVYNPEMDRKDFDDDDIMDEDNVFSEFYVPKRHPDLPTINETVTELNAYMAGLPHDEFTPEDIAYSNFTRQSFTYEELMDDEFQEQFRGHLVVACTPEDSDLEIAEKITAAMDKALGKQLYVETRVISHAKLEDNVFEVWLESYEIDLLHSKKRATGNVQEWNGPAECDDKQIEALVEKVSYLISDEARYSYTLEFDGVV
eukprot:Sro213_g088350.2  (653) ;mRNA; f:18476-20512